MLWFIDDSKFDIAHWYGIYMFAISSSLNQHSCHANTYIDFIVEPLLHDGNRSFPSFPLTCPQVSPLNNKSESSCLQLDVIIQNPSIGCSVGFHEFPWNRLWNDTSFANRLIAGFNESVLFIWKMIGAICVLLILISLTCATSPLSCSFINKWYCNWSLVKFLFHYIQLSENRLFLFVCNNNTTLFESTMHFQRIITKFETIRRRNQAPKEYTDQTEYACPDRYESGKILIPSHEWESSLIKLSHMVKDWFENLRINARKSIRSLPLWIMTSPPFIFREITIAFRSILRSNKALNLDDI